MLKKQAKVWGDGVIWGDVSDPSAEIVSSVCLTLSYGTAGTSPQITPSPHKPRCEHANTLESVEAKPNAVPIDSERQAYVFALKVTDYPGGYGVFRGMFNPNVGISQSANLYGWAGTSPFILRIPRGVLVVSAGAWW